MFVNSTTGELIRKKFSSFRNPKKPFKRKLTEEETTLMYKHFKNHSWTNSIDKDGNIILGGGESSAGIYYITEEDLKKLQ